MDTSGLKRLFPIVAKTAGFFLFLIIVVLWAAGLVTGVRGQLHNLGIGKEPRVKALIMQAGAEVDWWKRWILYREALRIDPANQKASWGKERVYYHFVNEARRARARGDISRAVVVTVRALQVKPEGSSLWEGLRRLRKESRQKDSENQM